MVSFLRRENYFKDIALNLCKVIVNTNDTDAKHTWPGEKGNCCEVKQVRGTFKSRLDGLVLCEYSNPSSKFALLVEPRC